MPAPVRVDHLRTPWAMYVDGTVLIVRGATARDLPAVALMHSRCSAKSLLDRYRSGGRQPAIVVLERQVRDPLSFVVTADDGRIVALSRIAQDPAHGPGAGEIGVLVEDQWQRLGIGRRLLRHTAAAAAFTGYRQLISYPATIGAVVQRMVAGLGSTRIVSDPQRHLHTNLPDTARLGLGTLQPKLARPAISSVTG